MPQNDKMQTFNIHILSPNPSLTTVPLHIQGD